MFKPDREQLSELLVEIKEKYNTDLTNYAEASLSRRMERFFSLYTFESAYSFREKLLGERSYFEMFMKEITVNTTEMFRDPGCWRIIREQVLPGLSAHDNIRIWHAGCSSGEEVISMAIVLEELGLADKARIVASDVSGEILQTAMSATYSRKTFALNEENYTISGGEFALGKYMKVQDDVCVCDKHLLRNVRFMKHDLSSGAAFSKFDLILCRNVMIYFNKSLQERVFRLFHSSLFKKGVIVIGKKESMAYYSGASLFSELNSDEKIYGLK